MSSWGSQRIVTLKVPPLQILSSFNNALQCDAAVVAYEILLSVRRLVKK